MSEQKTYDPNRIEPKWMERWLSGGMFHANEGSERPAYSIVIPPPNVTGSLHLGHALNNTLQDVLCRYKRMTGHEVLWMPGTDHAGIATQNVVERQLAAEGKSRRDLGREAFVERVWQWKEQSGGQIIGQLKRLGCSCDWERERFTMDEGLSHAVREVFVRLYNEGLIYRGDYMINWCPRCESALADLEVEFPDEPEQGWLYRLRYPLAEPTAEVAEIVVDTTRPETMLGDTAIAVHPEDERYRHLVGKMVRLPVTGREIPIIADAFVDPEFGSGAVKVTPGHDPNDFEAGRRHNLEIISVIGPEGRMTANVPEQYRGLDRFACRKKLVSDLEAQGVLVAQNPYALKTGRCYRCQTVTEPLVSTQWFMRMKDMAQEAAAAIRDGRTKMVPATWESTYFQWLDNIRDWCISRQLWWGHQIPVWYCSCGEVIAAMDTPTKCPSCGSSSLKQDPDVLDTWFSSALWPFSTMDWPKENATLAKFYPTSVLVTGFDILFFWVARMMMMGLKLTGTVPFDDIFLHAMVRDEHGQKMSKTKGNVIDPLEIVDRYGADALRFTLTILTVQGRDVNLATSRIEGYRNFINKLWNAVRYVKQAHESEGSFNVTIDQGYVQRVRTDLFARWLFSRLARTVEANREGYTAYHFSELCNASYRFVWDEFCAWYLELTKVQLRQATDAERKEIVTNLLAVCDVVIRLLHPVVPFVTEELWASLPEFNGEKRDTLSRHEFPHAEVFGGLLRVDDEAERKMSLFCDVVTAVRTIRAEKNIPPAAQVVLHLEGDEAEVSFIREQERYLAGLARVSRLEVGAPTETAAAKVVAGLRVSVPLAGAVDLKSERERVLKELKKLDQEIARVKGKLGSADFRARAPEEVVAKEERKLREFEEQHRLLDATARELGAQ